MASLEETDTNEMPASSVRDLALKNTHDPELDANRLEQERMTTAEETVGETIEENIEDSFEEPIAKSIETTTPGDNALTTTTATDVVASSNPPDASTRSVALGASQAAVLNTMELLESIISFIPRPDILTKAMRVSRTWKKTIDTSPTIQTLLWRGSLVLSPYGNTHDPNNPHEQWLVFNSTSNFNAPTKQAFGVPMYSDYIELNELYFSAPRDDEYTGYKNHIKRFRGIRAVAPDRFKDGPMSWAYKQTYILEGIRPSWLYMFITSPPITAAQVSVFMWSSVMAVPQIWVCATVYDRGGITYATAADVVRRIKRAIPPHQFVGNEYLPPMIAFVADGKKVSTAITGE